MDLVQVVVPSIVAGAFAVATSIVTARLAFVSEKRRFARELEKTREEWRREFAAQYAEAAASNPGLAGALRQQFAQAYLALDETEASPSTKSFIPITGRLVLGRAQDCDIVISDPAVSRQHATIEVVDGSVRLTDLNARGGTSVDGEPVKGSVLLKDGARLQFGKATASLHLLPP